MKNVKKELIEKLEQVRKLCEGDEEKEAHAKILADDLKLHGETSELLENETYRGFVEKLEQTNELSKEALMKADLTRTSNDLIRQVIADYQANLRVINTLKGPKMEDLEAKLDRTVAALKEEAEISEENAK